MRQTKQVIQEQNIIIAMTVGNETIGLGEQESFQDFLQEKESKDPVLWISAWREVQRAGAATLIASSLKSAGNCRRR